LRRSRATSAASAHTGSILEDERSFDDVGGAFCQLAADNLSAVRRWNVIDQAQHRERKGHGSQFQLFALMTHCRLTFISRTNRDNQ
jgi:hypothetical protein